mgnify:CR=1 FL=1
MNVLREKTWSPYVAGALAGLLLVLSVFLTGKYFGASTTFVRAAGFVEQAVAPEKVAGMEYFLKEKVKIDWQFLFVVGVLRFTDLGVPVGGTAGGGCPVHVGESLWGVPNPALDNRLSRRDDRHVWGTSRGWVTERSRPERSGSGSPQRLCFPVLLLPGRGDHGQNPVRGREKP